jgi:hypothetical protein
MLALALNSSGDPSHAVPRHNIAPAQGRGDLSFDADGFDDAP